MAGGDLAAGKTTAAGLGAWICFQDESGQSLRPPKGRTWAPVGQTPIVKVTGKGSGRVSVAGLICVKPGRRTRLIYRTITFHGRKHERKGFGIVELQRLLTAAHNQLHAPIVLVWDNLNAHVGPVMRAFIVERDWLTVFRLPGYAPELNPAEGVWANLKGRLRNLAVRTVDQLTTVIKTHLKRMQYRPGLLEAIIAETGLTLAQPP